MHDKIRESMKRISNKIHARFQKGNIKITTRQAIGLSLILHLAASLVIAAIYGDKMPALLSTKKEDLKFEFIMIDDTDMGGAEPSGQSKAAQANSAVKKAGKKIGLSSNTSKKLVAENVNVNKEAVMLASLASLSELQESFRFVIQELSVNEEGAFAPIHGDVPDTKVIADGLINGYGFGGRAGIISTSGGGNGNCPPRPRP